jgi:hypothetical protein
MEFLVEALNLTQQPSSANFQRAEEMLISARQHKEYFGCLLDLIAKDEMPENIKLASACCLAKDLKTFLKTVGLETPPELIEEVLGSFKNNVFQVLAKHVFNAPICNKLEEALKSVIHKIYPLHWQTLGSDLLGVMKESNNFQILYATLKGVNYMLSKYKNCVRDKREPLKFVSKQTLPFVENLSIKLLNQIQSSNNPSYNIHGIIIRILNTILKCFKSVNYLQIETEYFTVENSKIWLFCFIKCFELGNAFSSQEHMSPHWDQILKKEDHPSTKMMIKSLECLIILLQQFKHRFRDFGILWNAFSSASKVVINNLLKYLNDFKEVYLSADLRNPNSKLVFKSPWVTGLVIR